MNKVIMIGRLTKDPDVRRTQDGKAVGNYTLAVDRQYAKSEKKADFIRCQVWEKKAEFVEQYLRKGMKIAITGRIQTGEYTNKNGEKVYTTVVVVEDQEFCEKKSDNAQQSAPVQDPWIPPQDPDEWASIAPGEGLPWD